MNRPVDGASAPDLPEPTLRDLPAFAALCLTTRGPYWKLSGPFRRLRALLGDLGVTPAGPAFGIFYDDPERVPAGETRFSLCCPLAPSARRAVESRLADGFESEDLEPDDEVAVHDFPAKQVAVLEYDGPAGDSPAAYAHLAVWVTSRGLEPEGPPREVYLAEPGTLGKGLMHAEVHQPLAPTAR